MTKQEFDNMIEEDYHNPIALIISIVFGLLVIIVGGVVLCVYLISLI
jgi:hypothetical protein